LPDVQTVIFDEAHQIPDIASNFLGSSFSSWQIMELANDTRAAEMREKSLVASLTTTADQLDKMVADYRLSLGLNERRVSWNDLTEEVPNIIKKMTVLADKLHEFSELLELASPAGEALTRCYERALELSQECYKIAADTDDEESIRWVEISRRTFRINETPLDVGAQLSQYFGNADQARIFTSATLSINGKVYHNQKKRVLIKYYMMKFYPFYKRVKVGPLYYSPALKCYSSSKKNYLKLNLKYLHKVRQVNVNY